MPKNKNNLYYSYPDFRLASNIIKILALNPKISSKRIGTLLSDIKKSATPPAIKIALERLVETEYVKKESVKHKTRTDNIWELSCIGKLVSLTILEHDDFDSFIKKEHEFFENRFYTMLILLIENSKKEFVQLLVDRLNKIKDDKLKIENTAIEWYNDMRNKIATMKIQKNDSTLAMLQQKINIDNSNSLTLRSRGYNENPMLSNTKIDKICQ